MPQVDRDSGSRRVYDIITLLQEEGWKVAFVSHHDLPADRYARVLQRRGVAVFLGAQWVERLVASCHFDLAIFCLWHIAEPWLPLIRGLAPRTRIIVDSVDLHFVRLARRAFSDDGAGDAPGRLDDAYANELAREINVYAAVDAVLTVSRKEASLIRDLTGDAVRAYEVTDSEDLPPGGLSFAEREGILFLGCFRHPPNLHAAEYLFDEILPQVDPTVLGRHPVSIVGDGADGKLRELCGRSPHARLVGWVPSIDAYFERTRISVVPLLYGAGTKRKVIQGLMTGTPTVTTPIGAEGLDLVDGEHVLIASDPAEFAGAITRLLEDPSLWSRLASRGRAHILAKHGRDASRGQLLGVVDRVLTNPPRRPPRAEDRRLTGDRDYRQVVEDTKETIRRTLPRDGGVLVVSRGDNLFTDVEGYSIGHFPQAEDGRYAGHYPANAAAAIAHLERLRLQGARFLIFPETSAWWLDYYPELCEHLKTHGREFVNSPGTCVVYALGPSAERATSTDAGPATGPIEARGLPSTADPAPRLIAFYLPQFHRIPENDAWWGRGFTEWTNVTKARPLFPGHYQPHLPSELGFYDLRLPGVREAQAELASDHGIYGFCYYHYWFHGKRLLEVPFEEVLESGRPAFPFCLCWANEPWSRRWDGRKHDILQAQTYGIEDDRNHLRSLIPALSDPRAIRIDGKPVFIVYQARDLPEPGRTAEIWREEAARAGLPGLYLMAVETGWDEGWDATQIGFDAKILFQPQFSMLDRLPRIGTSGPGNLAVYDYQQAWSHLADGSKASYTVYHTVFPSWDNSPRKGEQGVVLHNSTPEAYEAWLRRTIERVRGTEEPSRRIVFINAWNEWGEGCHLEPDDRHGRAYLEATRRALKREHAGVGPGPNAGVGVAAGFP